MKKFSFPVTLLLMISTSFAQKYYTSSAVITFTSEAPMEKIVSANKQVTGMLNTSTNEIAFKVIMKSFQFERQGMYDHFNNEYTESDKFPNATFMGKFSDPVDLTKNGVYTVNVEGKLTIHGMTMPLKQTGKVEVEDGKITVRSTFKILLSDFGIRVSADYIKRISNTVQLDINAVLTPYVR